MAAMVPSSRHHHIQQLANMLHDKSMLLKLENVICLANCMSDVPQPLNHQKTNQCPTSYLRQ
jgi:hypothetical protein